MNFKILVMAWLLLLLSLVSGATAATLEWSKETVDSDGNTGFYTSIALDSSDNPHMSYWTAGATVDWSKETVDSSGDVGEYSSIALDSSGYPHISYLDSSDNSLNYAKWTGTEWSTETIGSVAGFEGSSITVNSSDIPHISYCDDSGLNYVTWSGTEWTTKTLDVNGAGRSSIALSLSGNPQISYIASGGLTSYLNHTTLTVNGWSTKTVNSGEAISGVSLAVNSTGIPHMSYQHDQDLKYAKWVGDKAEWSIETIDSLGYGDHSTSIVIDSSDNPHISYRATGVESDELRYATHTDLGWSTITVESGFGSNVGKYSSIDVDSSDNPHISYYYSSPQDLRYAKWTGTEWSMETIDSEGDVGKYSSIAIDSSDNPHISYFDYTNQNLKYAKYTGSEGEDLEYATWTGTEWSRETVVSASGLGGTSIAIDSSNNPHISYCDDSGLNYATWTGSTWSLQTIDSDGGGKSSIAIDSSGNPHITYIAVDGFTEYLNYAKWTGSSWSTQTVDSGEAISGVSLALDSSDNPHVSYQDVSNQYLEYATWDGSSWSTQTVDSSLGFGDHPSSIVIDSSDNPHISYRAYTDSHELRYATLTGSGWSTQTIESGFGSNVGKYSSIDVDSSDNPHISYYYSSSEDLRYAKLEESTWSMQTIDSDGNVGKYSSIAIDSSNNPHISYLDYTNQDLKYAKLTGTPAIVTLQGKLTDSSGEPVQTGSVRVTVKSGGSQVWQNTFDNELDDGVFNIALGAVKPMYLTTGEIYQMVVEIDADSTTFSSADVTFGDNSPYDDIIKFKA